MRIGQSSIEGALIITFMIFVMVAFMGIMIKRMVETEEQRRLSALQEIANSLKGELELAVKVQGGYRRNFSLPATAAGQEYSVTLINSTALGANYSQLVLNTSGGRESIVELTPKNLFGRICVGPAFVNSITKNGESVIIQCHSS